MDENPLPLIRLLLARLERISADSVWAHRASGVRGALLKTMDYIEKGGTPAPRLTSTLIGMAFDIIDHAIKYSKSNRNSM